MSHPTLSLFTVANGIRHLDPRVCGVRRRTLNPESVQIDFADSFAIVTPEQNQFVTVLFKYREHPKADWSTKRLTTTVGSLPDAIGRLLDARFLGVVA